MSDKENPMDRKAPTAHVLRRARKRDWPELDWALIQKALDGDRRAFRQFYDCYEPRLRFAVGARLRYRWPDSVAAFEDIVQSVWRYLKENDWRRLRRYNPHRGVPFGFFLTMIGAALASTLAYREQRLVRGDAIAFEITEQELNRLVDVLVARDRLRQLDEFLRELKPKNHELFVLFYIKGQKLKDIAARWGWHDNRIYTRKKRLDDKLRDLWGSLMAMDDDPSGPMSVIAALALVALTLGGWGWTYDEPSHGPIFLSGFGDSPC